MIPKVSVLIPLFNSEKYIAETIECALNQTWKNLEVVVVDDGSTDRSLAIAKTYKSDRVHVTSQRNKGACAARNLAFSVSDGDYIQYLDADDLISPDKIEKQLLLLDNIDGAVAFCNWGRFYNSICNFNLELKQINKDYDSPINWLIDSWNGKGVAQTSVWLTPRKIIDAAGGWNEELHLNQDGEFFARVLIQAKLLKFCSSVFVYYRSDNPNSLSQSNKSEVKAESLLKSFESYKDHTIEKYDKPEIRRALVTNFCNFIYLYSPNYPHLIERAYQNIKELAGSGKSTMGGFGFKMITRFLGFSNAIRFRNFIKS